MSLEGLFTQSKDSKRKKQGQRQVHPLAQLTCDGFGQAKGGGEGGGEEGGGERARCTAAKFLTYFYGLLKQQFFPQPPPLPFKHQNTFYLYWNSTKKSTK